MSIYGTGYVLSIHTDGELVEVIEQIVGSHIREPYDWLPPPRPEVSDDDSYVHPRAAVFVLAGERKGGDDYAGQQYHRPLLVLSGEEYERSTWRDVMRRLADAIKATE